MFRIRSGTSTKPYAGYNWNGSILASSIDPIDEYTKINTWKSKMKCASNILTSARFNRDKTK